MRHRRTSKDGFGIIGIGAAACVACCAGPILAFFGFSLAGAASAWLFGVAGLGVAGVASAAYLVLRRGRHGGRATGPIEPVPMANPTRKVAS